MYTEKSFRRTDMTMEFVHPTMGEEIRSIAGYYIAREEQIVRFEDREIVCVFGNACIDTSCCGYAAWSYVQVPGFLVRKHVRGGGGEPLVSEVEMIPDEDTRRRVKHFLADQFPGTQPEIW